MSQGIAQQGRHKYDIEHLDSHELNEDEAKDGRSESEEEEGREDSDGCEADEADGASRVHGARHGGQQHRIIEMVSSATHNTAQQ